MLSLPSKLKSFLIPPENFLKKGIALVHVKTRVCVIHFFHDCSAQSSLQTQHFFDSRREVLKNRNWSVSVLHYFTWKIEFLSYIFSIIVSGKRFLFLTRASALQTLIFGIFLKLGGFSQSFNLKLKQLSYKKR